MDALIAHRLAKLDETTADLEEQLDKTAAALGQKVEVTAAELERRFEDGLAKLEGRVRVLEISFARMLGWSAGGAAVGSAAFQVVVWFAQRGM